jgi:hypothetical protein
LASIFSWLYKVLFFFCCFVLLWKRKKRTTFHCGALQDMKWRSPLIWNHQSLVWHVYLKSGNKNMSYISC